MTKNFLYKLSDEVKLIIDVYSKKGISLNFGQELRNGSGTYKDVFDTYVLSDLTLKKTADKFGLRSERVRQIVYKGLRILRHPYMRKQLETKNKDT